MTSEPAQYRDFIAAKLSDSPDQGMQVSPNDLHPALKPHQRDIVSWALRRGRAAIFASFGLGKSLCQLEIARQVLASHGGRFLIVAPLGVRQEFVRDGRLIGVEVKFVRRIEECGEDGVYLTNYETIRDAKLDARMFSGVSLDEAGILRHLGGAKTFRALMERFEGWGRFKFVATATPSPNEYLELSAYSAFLDILDVGQVKTRFFRRDSENADHLELWPHKEGEFWRWVHTWAIFLSSPADLGYDDGEYVLPPLRVHWEELPTEHAGAGVTPSGQGKLLRDSALGVRDAAAEKKRSAADRIAACLAAADKASAAGGGRKQFIVWCEQNAEQKAVERGLAGLGISWTSISGATDQESRMDAIEAWRDGRTTALVTKPGMYGSGANFQQCHLAFYVGIGFKFSEFIQSLHRIHRFMQKEPVDVTLFYTEAEREVRRVLEGKWQNHERLVEKMREIVREHGLSKAGDGTGRASGVCRREVSGNGWRMVLNDCVDETAALEPGSVSLVVTSVPFSNQYMYSDNARDFGFSDTNADFFRQMDFLTPNLLRALQPGRIAAIHVKDRIVPSGLSGMGFQTVYPFHAECIAHYQKHGFGFLGMKTIVTDVVRENNQTYRLGWTEQCKDGSRMGVGMPEYLLLFRKPPTDQTNGYADVPVVKDKADYTRSRWQIDAHGFARSSGDRRLTPEELKSLPHDAIFKLHRKFSLETVYDFEGHVGMSESMEACGVCGHIHAGEKSCKQCECRIAGGRLPSTFMLLQPASWHPDVWTDVARMRTHNMNQERRGREFHLAPLQFDICDRAIAQFSMPGELVLDPFAGVGTVPDRAVRLGRRGLGIELNENYFVDACHYCRAAEGDRDMPSLFGLDDAAGGQSLEVVQP